MQTMCTYPDNDVPVLQDALYSRAPGLLATRSSVRTFTRATTAIRIFLLHGRIKWVPLSTIRSPWHQTSGMDYISRLYGSHLQMKYGTFAFVLVWKTACFACFFSVEKEPLCLVGWHIIFLEEKCSFRHQGWPNSLSLLSRDRF